jgi:Holliday junction resolvasome RuvABC endonuclease subunit
VAIWVAPLINVSLEGVVDDATDAVAVAFGCCYRAASEPRAVVG